EAHVLGSRVSGLAKQSVSQGDDCGRALAAREVEDEILGAGARVAIRKIVGQSPERRGNGGVPVHAVPRREALPVAEVMIQLDVHLVRFALVDTLAEPVVDVRKRLAVGRRLRVIAQYLS